MFYCVYFDYTVEKLVGGGRDVRKGIYFLGILEKKFFFFFVFF